MDNERLCYHPPWEENLRVSQRTDLFKLGTCAEVCVNIVTCKKRSVTV